MEEKSNKLKVLTSKTFLLRVISLLCAILLWFYVSEVESPTAEKSVESVAITLRNKDIMMNETGLSVISDAVERAEAYCYEVIPAMEKLREVVDTMEPLTASDYWPYPSYGEMLFSV